MIPMFYVITIVIVSAVAPLWSCTATDRMMQDTQAVTVVFKHGKIAGDSDSFQLLLRRFEAENPGIQIKDETLPASTDQQHQFYVTSLDSRSSDFDVLAMDVIWAPEFARAGWIRDLSHLLSVQERDQFFPGPVEAVTFEGKIFAIPWYIDAGLLYYRKDLLDKHGFSPPKTWEDLAIGVRAILAKENDPHLKGFIWQGKQYEGLICNVLEYIWSAGGEVLDVHGRVVLNHPQAQMALSFMRDLIVQGVSSPMVTTADEEATRRVFGEGRAIFLRNWPYAWNIFEREGAKVRGKVGVVPLPSFEGFPSAATLGGWQLGINRNSRHPEEAEALIQFLTSPEAQRWMALEIGYKPTRKALYQDEELIASQPFITGLYGVFLSAKPRPVSPYYLMLSQVMQPEFSAALVGLKSPEEALRDAQLQMNHILFGRPEV